MRIENLLTAALLALCACQGAPGDESMYLTGTESEALIAADGTPTCSNPKKVLVCHIPPGNPANAHTICVGEPAVAPHQRLHGDTLGPCAPTTTDGGSGGSGGGDADAGSGGGGGAGGGGAPMCTEAGGSCQASGECCSNLRCESGSCVPMID